MTNHVSEAKKALATLIPAVDRMQSQIDALVAENHDLRRRMEEAERRAAIDQQQADDMTEKASRTAELEEECRKLLDALDRLPTKMEDAGVMLSVINPDIPLYGTYEWQAVTDAKFGLKKAMKQR